LLIFINNNINNVINNNNVNIINNNNNNIVNIGNNIKNNKLTFNFRLIISFTKNNR